MKRTGLKKRNKMSRRLLPVLMMLLLMISAVGLLGGCGQKEEEIAAAEGITSLEQLKEPGVKIGVVTDTPEYKVVQREFPEAEIVYTKDSMFAYTSVAQGKLDAFVSNRLNMVLAIQNGMKGVRLLEESLDEGNVGAVAVSPITKIPDLRDKINEFLQEIKEDGTFAEIQERWLEKRNMVMPDIPEAKDPQYHLVVGTTGVSEPFTCYVNNELTGYDIELAKRFAAWFGASLEFEVYDYEGIIPAALGGEVDCIFANLYITPEREEAVDFSTPTYTVEVGVMVQDTVSAEAAAGGNPLIESFYKTFVREDRWKMFLKGIATTLIITILSIVFGTAIGFGAFLLCRNGNTVANVIAKFCIWLIEGMPVVVLLMILYYIVFSKAKVSGVFISVVAFTLIFSAAVFSMLKAGVSAVDTGQMEAAYSLGYTDRKAFFVIILPQALAHVMPSYKTQIKSLIKATAVVGYVAVQDLTKIGDIVRSRTYEAFFPLIAIAVFYFILAAFLIWIVNKIEIQTLPKCKAVKKKHIWRGKKND